MNIETLCAANEDGRACRRAAVIRQPVALCAPHRLEIAVAVVPDLLRGTLIAAKAEAAAPAPQMELIDHAQRVAHEPLLASGDVHDAVVYFIVNGGRVKIGYTTNLRGRLSALTLRSDNVLLTLAGGPDLERALHSRFSTHRHGNSEWFDLAPEVLRFIATPPGPAPMPRAQALVEPTPARAATDVSGAGEEETDSIAATVRRCIREGTTDIERVLPVVRQAHGSDVPRATVWKTLARATGRTAS